MRQSNASLGKAEIVTASVQESASLFVYDGFHAFEAFVNGRHPANDKSPALVFFGFYG